MKKACILSNGCPESLIDCARVKLYFEENGWYTTDDSTTADLILLYACALTNNSTDYSLNIVKELQEKAKHDSKVMIWGCLPKTDYESLKQIYVGPTFSESDLYKLDEIIHAQKPIDDITANEVCSRYRNSGSFWSKIYKSPIRLFNLYYNHLYTKRNLHKPKDSSIFYIKISTGCLGHCTYCSVRLSRGKTKSKPIDKIISEFRDGLSRGYKTFALLGTDLSSYGRDFGYTLADLLREMVREKGEYRIGLRNLNPYFLNQMMDDLEPVFATGKIWYTEIAAESGSNKILKLMERDYTVETLKESIQRLRKACPSLMIRTQIMVGFPTETKQDFTETMCLLDEVKFDFVEVYRFSPRSGTAAEKMQGRISNRVMRLRSYRIVGKIVLDNILKMGRKPLNNIRSINT